MKFKKIFQILLFSMAIAITGANACVQRPVRTEGIKVTAKGTIDYMKFMGGYYVKGEDPPEALFIDNPNTLLLEKLFKSRKTVMIDGHLTIGADHLFIERIDGEPYRGDR